MLAVTILAIPVLAMTVHAITIYTKNYVGQHYTRHDSIYERVIGARGSAVAGRWWWA